MEGKPPGQLDDQFTCVSAVDAQVIRDGQNISSLSTHMIVDFVIPAGQSDKNLVILHWDAAQSEWVEVAGDHVNADGYFEGTNHFTGTFVLVTK